MAMNNNSATGTKRRRAAMGIFAACVLYVASSMLGMASYGGVGSHGRMLRADANGGGKKKFETLSELVARLRSQLDSDAMRSVPAIMSHGAGPELTGLKGEIFKFHGEIRNQGISWYRVLSSRRLQWNIAPYRWNSCPDGDNVFLGDTGFSFHLPDPKDPSEVSTKNLRFRILRRDERECTWNYSQACLAGGSFVMNLGKTATNVLYPGDYSLKTPDGVIRVVAYNTNRDCSRQVNGSRTVVTSSHHTIDDKAPIDYLREARSSTMFPNSCEEFIKERERRNDLFSYNSDLATINVDTPWMQIVIQVRQNKVATDDSCIFANMNVWITNISPELMDEDFGGVLGESHSESLEAEQPMMRHRALKYEEAGEHEVDGPFDA